MDCWIAGLLDCWIVGLLDCWIIGFSINPVLHQSIIPYAIAGIRYTKKRAVSTVRDNGLLGEKAGKNFYRGGKSYPNR
jgi:hypothetical protein